MPIELLKFGIPSFDAMINMRAKEEERGYLLNSLSGQGEATTVCLIGPDGTGKSLFALHLVSDYARQMIGSASPGKILYASTDLSLNRAQKVWEKFWLDKPEFRGQHVPFRTGTAPSGAELISASKWQAGTTVKLEGLKPAEEPEQFAEYLARDDASTPYEIGFLDLASTTGGDDWHLLNTILGTLKGRVADGPKHMLVIDAVEGLETLVGGRDSMGEQQERRARIAHLIRVASQKCHLVFVVEEPKGGERLPEVFVSDVVVRMRTTADRDYSVRTVELEKVRGQRHVRGQHHFHICQGDLLPTNEDRPDEPAVQVQVFVESEPHVLSYIHVYPSLHQSAADVTKWEPRTALAPRAGFGIEQLDNMLAECTLNDQKHGGDGFGLPAGSVTAIIGEQGTFKSQLARAFLAQCFRTRVTSSSEPKPCPINGRGVAVLLTTYDTDRCRLADQLQHHLTHPQDKETVKQPKSSLLVRRLDMHHMPASVFLHVVRELIQEARRRLIGALNSAGVPLRQDDVSQNWRIRFVLDDWSAAMDMYPEAKRDPLLVPHLIQYLRQQGVTALILATHPGRPDGGAAMDVRERLLPADHYLYTWQVPFYGDRRVAITALPSLSPRDLTAVRELRRARAAELGPATPPAVNELTHKELADHRELVNKEALVVDPHFELYQGLDEGNPQPVPLEVILYAEHDHLPAFESYRREVGQLFKEVFGHGDGRTTVAPLYGVGYDLIHEQTYLQSGARLSRSLVIQVDEFWAESRFELRRTEDYLNAVTADASCRPNAAEDPYLLFQPTDEQSSGATAAPPDAIEATPPDAPPLDALGVEPVVVVPGTPEAVVVAPETPLAVVDDATPSLDVPPPVAPGVEPVVVAPEVLAGDAATTLPAAEATTRPVPVPPPAAGYQRRDFFHLIGNDLIGSMATYAVDKVPYTWDFGMLLCDRRAWALAAKEKDERTKNPWRGDHQEQSVGDIWHRMWKVSVPDETGLVHPEDANAPRKIAHAHFVRQTPEGKHVTVTASDTKGERRYVDPVSWREFLGACKTIARYTRYECPAFDIDLLAVESFSCLVLEVWMSEWHLLDSKFGFNLNDPAHAAGAAGSHSLKAPADLPSWALRGNRGWSVSDSLAERLDTAPTNPGFKQAAVFREALYRAVLLLDESLTPAQLAHDNMALRARPSGRAAASRHWYSTAAPATVEPDARRDLCVVGLPGHYTTRGDWFLGMAAGSRSPRLAHRVMDILGSRRANIVRLQTGLGLPTRDVTPLDGKNRLEDHRTALVYVTDGGQVDTVLYRDLRQLGAYDARDGRGRGDEFHWLWRSNIRHYDLHARIWQKWLVHLFIKWRTWSRPGGVWDGFQEYDTLVAADKRPELEPALQATINATVDRAERHSEFLIMCDHLVATLRRATPRQVRS